MEKPESLNKRQVTRRIEADNEAIKIISDALLDISKDKAALQKRPRDENMDESNTFRLSESQLDDQIKAYSQVYSKLRVAANTMESKLKTLTAAKTLIKERAKRGR